LWWMHRNPSPQRGRVFYCKGNPAVLRRSLSLARENPKRIYEIGIIHKE
jgi:hypothetical protein